MTHLGCAVKPKHEAPVLMKDTPPHRTKEGVQRYRGESLEELGPSSKSIVTRLYYPPKLRDRMEATRKEPIWCSDIITSTQGWRWGAGEQEKVNHLNSLESSIIQLKENMGQCEHDLGSVTSGFLY